MLTDYFLIIKAIHVIGVIAWMAGLLYLPRLYAYHAEAEPGSRQSETFKAMERRLLRAIINPAMIVALVFGVLAAGGMKLSAGDVWLWIKLAAVLALMIVHVLLARWRREFEADANHRSARFYKTVNEVPTLLMIVIVIMVVVKPF
ncbi:MAG: protoporphyrinogen oxidase HemJ [Alphaproteobacteria bacterium]|nr:protoporphyrinogen oxidase HemJ [Alphaproteobacteria bacterium]MCZ6763514.1 protoporphyrinogen oxidase HemJ [Alphaproteobacteria bacterium]